MNKIRIGFISLTICLLSLTIVGASSTHDSCTLYFTMSSVESDIVGTSDSATFKTTTNSKSHGQSYTFCHAAWTGCLFTIERKFETPSGRSTKVTEYQSKRSNFYTQVTSSMGNTTEAVGEVTTN